MTQQCLYCNGTMDETTTTFTVAKQSGVFVVNDVPVLECQDCGQLTYRQEVAERLEKIVSGRALAKSQELAWVFNWADELRIIPVRDPVSGTINKSLRMIDPLGSFVFATK